MADVNRTLVDKLVLHHAVTPLWSEKSKAQLAQWFSDNGFARAYGSNSANWSGLINPYTGARSYSQAHYAGQRVDGSTPDATAAERAAGYRLVQLVNDVWGQITWHAGNWAVNCGSIGIENLGDYRNYPLREGDCQVIADFWRPRDRQLGGATMVYGHKEVSQLGTECPARIMESRDHIIDLINTNPTPPTPPAPTPNVQKYEKIAPGTYKFIRDANLWNFDFATQAQFTVAKSFKAGEKIDIVGKAVWKNGTSEYYMTAYSFGNADTTGKPNATTGVNKVDLELVKNPVITTKDETKTQDVAFQTIKSTDATLPEGQEKVTRAGVKGVRTIIYTVTYTDGVETARVVKSDSVTTPAIDELVSVGSYVEPPVNPPVVPVPEDGESAISWLSKVWAIIKKVLESFTYKKK